MKFGEMLTHARSIATIGTDTPVFSWAVPGDIVIMGDPPADFEGRVCSVKLPDEPAPLYCRLYKDGSRIKLGYRHPGHRGDHPLWPVQAQQSAAG